MRRRALLAASQMGGGGDAVIIEFTIAGSPMDPGGTYQAEEGMSWREWVASPYNVDEYSIWNHPVHGEIPVSKNRSFIYNNSGPRVFADDIISPQGHYYLS